MSKCREAFIKRIRLKSMTLPMVLDAMLKICISEKSGKERFADGKTEDEFEEFTEIWNASHDRCAELCREESKSEDDEAQDGYKSGFLAATDQCAFTINNDKLKI